MVPPGNHTKPPSIQERQVAKFENGGGDAGKFEAEATSRRYLKGRMPPKRSLWQEGTHASPTKESAKESGKSFSR